MLFCTYTYYEFLFMVHGPKMGKSITGLGMFYVSHNIIIMTINIIVPTLISISISYA